jgi:hypothetical protein
MRRSPDRRSACPARSVTTRSTIACTARQVVRSSSATTEDEALAVNHATVSSKA